MISAKEARAQSVENKLTNALKDAEEKIKKAIKQGKNEANFLTSYDLVEAVTEQLRLSGYTVTEIQGGVKIYWGVRMNPTLTNYIKTCDLDTLYNIFDLVIEEMNRRKDKDTKENDDN